jgi:hypothetical protein
MSVFEDFLTSLKGQWQQEEYPLHEGVVQDSIGSIDKLKNLIGSTGWGPMVTEGKVGVLPTWEVEKYAPGAEGVFVGDNNGRSDIGIKPNTVGGQPAISSLHEMAHFMQQAADTKKLMGEAQQQIKLFTPNDNRYSPEYKAYLERPDEIQARGLTQAMVNRLSNNPRLGNADERLLDLLLGMGSQSYPMNVAKRATRY